MVKHEHTGGGGGRAVRGHAPSENLKFRSSNTAGNEPKTRVLLILSLSMGMHPYSEVKNRIVRGARG